MEIVEWLENTLPANAQPHTVLPSQYYQRQRPLEGEHGLMFAVLDDAVRSYLKNMTAKSRRQRINFYEVRDWINARNRKAVFAYENLCDALAIDAARLRVALEERRRQYLASQTRRESDREASNSEPAPAIRSKSRPASNRVSKRANRPRAGHG